MGGGGTNPAVLATTFSGGADLVVVLRAAILCYGDRSQREESKCEGAHYD